MKWSGVRFRASTLCTILFKIEHESAEKMAAQRLPTGCNAKAAVTTRRGKP